MKKYITIPFNIYTTLIKTKEKKQNDITNSLEGLPKSTHTETQRNDSTGISDNNTNDKLKRIKDADSSESMKLDDKETYRESLEQAGIIEDTNSTSIVDSPSKQANGAPTAETLQPAVDAVGGVRPPPPGIPKKKKKAISIIARNINTNPRITRNRGKWITPWKTRFT